MFVAGQLRSLGSEVDHIRSVVFNEESSELLASSKAIQGRASSRTRCKPMAAFWMSFYTQALLGYQSTTHYLVNGLDKAYP